MTPEQQKALALAAARRRQSDEQGVSDPALKARVEAAKAGTLEVDPARAARAAELEDEMIRNNFGVPGRVGGAAGAAADGITFGHGDEALAGMSAVLGLQPDGKGGARWLDYSKPMGERYNVALDQIRREQGDFSEAHPALSVGAEIMGSAVIPGGAAKSAWSAGAIGAASGGLYGFGEGEGGFGSRVENAGKSAIAGGLLGVGAQRAGHYTSKALQSFTEKTSARPTIPILRQTKTMAYRAVDDSGERFSQQDIQGLVGNIEQRLDDVDFIEGAGGKMSTWLRRLRKTSERSEGISLSRLDDIRSNLWKAYNAADDEVEILGAIEAIDDLIDGRAGASDLMADARTANTIYRKAEMLEAAFRRAELQTSATGSGGNILNKYRQAVTSIITDDRRAKWFSPDEIALMESFVNGSTTENVLRRVGKLSPNGNGLMSALNLYAAAIDPTMLAATATTSGAKAMADRSAMRGAESIQDAVATGVIQRPKPAPPVNALAAGNLGSQFVR